jgi:hypothetical protein
LEPAFRRYIGIDYSGAETAYSSCKGIRVFMAEGSSEPAQVQPPPSPRRYWTRRGLAEWLREELDRDIPTLVGIDHAFSFPLAYFEKYRLSSDWEDFLVDFHHHWPTDAQHMYVCFIRKAPSGRGLKRTGERNWLRLTERWTPTAKSVFGFGGQGDVATSTHAGLPWLLYLSRAPRLSPRSIRPFGHAVTHGMTGTAMNMPHTRRLHGCNVPTVTAPSAGSSVRA